MLNAFDAFYYICYWFRTLGKWIKRITRYVMFLDVVVCDCYKFLRVSLRCFLQEHYLILAEGITRLVYPERINWVEWVKSSLRSLLGLSHLFFNFFFEDWKVKIGSQQLGKTEAKNGSGLHESAGKKSSIPVPNWGKKSLYALSHGSNQLQAIPRSPAHDRDFL